jgi:hypothetical protein
LGRFEEKKVGKRGGAEAGRLGGEEDEMRCRGSGKTKRPHLD